MSSETNKFRLNRRELSFGMEMFPRSVVDRFPVLRWKFSFTQCHVLLFPWRTWTWKRPENVFSYKLFGRWGWKARYCLQRLQRKNSVDHKNDDKSTDRNCFSRLLIKSSRIVRVLLLALDEEPSKCKENKEDATRVYSLKTASSFYDCFECSFWDYLSLGFHLRCLSKDFIKNVSSISSHTAHHRQMVQGRVKGKWSIFIEDTSDRMEIRDKRVGCLSKTTGYEKNICADPLSAWMKVSTFEWNLLYFWSKKLSVKTSF